MSSSASLEVASAADRRRGNDFVRTSIGIPFFNSETTLVQAIQSVFVQTYDRWELILVDDGSTDGSLDIAQRIRDSRVRVLADGVNRGLSYRLNQIAHLARGEYVARMDADDLMHPDRLARQVQFLDAHPDVDVVGTAVYSIDASNDVLGFRSISHRHGDPAEALRQGWLLHPTAMGRREWFRQNPYDASFWRAEDRELWCRTCQGSRFSQIEEALYLYRERVSFDLRKYLQSCAADRRIFWLHGPALVGYRNASWLVAKSFLKSWSYCLAVAFRGESALIRRRSQAVSEQERRSAAKVVEAILATPVPGLFQNRRIAEPN